MSNIIFKTLLLKGETGDTITSIEKTATEGLVDTYTVALNSGATFTIDVTNGSDIESIEKTSTNVLTDTYTVTLTNGDTATFEVTNGRGIESIEKTATEGLVDTYTITFNDDTTTTFTVTNSNNQLIVNEANTRAEADAVLREAIDELAGAEAGSTIVIDSSLSIEGAGADAKATGDNIIKLNNDISELNSNNVAFYGNYEETVLNKNNAVGFSNYDIIARSKLTSERCMVDTIYINTETLVGNGYIKLCAFDIINGDITNLVEDTTSYRVTEGENYIKTSNPFVIDRNKYIGLMQVSADNQYIGINSIYPTNDYNYGFLGRRIADNVLISMSNYILCLDFEVCGVETWYLNRVKTNWLYGKSWVAYGDSITAGYKLDGHNSNERDNNTVRTYARIIADKYQMNYINRGTSGRGYSVGQPYALYQTIDTAIENADIVTIAMGTNDFGEVSSSNIVTFGDFTDTESTVDENDKLTFCACVRKSFNKVLECYPNSIVAVMLPIPRPNMETPNYVGHILQDYSDMIAKIAKQYGFYVMDCPSLARSSVKSSSWCNTYMLDGVHMSQAYHDEYYSAMVEKELLRLEIN